MKGRVIRVSTVIVSIITWLRNFLVYLHKYTEYGLNTDKNNWACLKANQCVLIVCQKGYNLPILLYLNATNSKERV